MPKGQMSKEDRLRIQGSRLKNINAQYKARIAELEHGLAQKDQVNELAQTKKAITSAMRYIKPYNGPSRIWFAYQNKKLCIGGVDDSDGTVGGFIEEAVVMLKEYVKLDSSCIKAFRKLCGQSTCFGWEEPLITLFDEQNSN